MLRFFIFSTLLILPVAVLAQNYVPNYVPLVVIPGVENTNDFGSYINALYGLSISIAALLAVIKIIIAGVKWMMTDVVPNKSEAKKDIQGALLGLLVVLAAVLILTVINQDLTTANFNFEGTGGIAANEGINTNSSGGSELAEVCAVAGGCSNVECPLVRWQLTCTGWCEDQGGVFRETFGGALTTNECVVPNSVLDTRPCNPIGQGQYDCDFRIEDCLNADYDEVILDGIQQIRCAYSN